MDMTDSQLNRAVEELVQKFPRVEKLPIDPPISNQAVGLFSFKLLEKPVNGVYGFLKFRGAFGSENEWMGHAKNLIRTVDSKHKIWPYEQGRWMPITNNDSFAKETLDVSQQDELKQIYNKNETEEQKKDIKAAKEVKDRVNKLLDESQQPADKSSLDYYAQQVMKLEQTESWLEAIQKRKREFVASLKKTQEEIARVESLHPEYVEQVQDKIKEIKADIGLGIEDGPKSSQL